MATAQQTAVGAYRALLQAQRALFRGDLGARASALAETRMRFLENANASADELPALVKDAYEAAVFIRQNVAQTTLNEHGNYEFKPTPDHMYQGSTPADIPFQPHDNLNK